MEIQTYAPVVIPTLCRYKEFVILMESLRKNTLADKTEVYVYLDYPKAEKHEEGYNKICHYLDTVTGFKKLHVIKRESNWGARENSEDCALQMMKHYDCFIFTEDDDEFSPNFLEFINKGLEKFKDDPKVFAINGYKHFYNIKYADNNFFMENVDFSSWGYGIWTNKMQASIDKMQGYYFRKALLNPFKLYKVIRNGWNHVLSLIYLSTYKYAGKFAVDGLWSLYCAIEELDIVMPVVSKVKNHGITNGMSAEVLGIDYSELSKKFEEQVMDTDTHFNFVGDGYNYYDQNREIYKAEGYERMSFWDFLKAVAKRIVRPFTKESNKKIAICNVNLR